ncbi:HDOD domain-containing protein [Gemmata sp. JC717]|uniref:HDOD domain-containing protein n=1 Tax=Gemmata algarum TaxID=2975278 RepID=UPI0021BBB241|nr:HDOD domain-containing protein [Gemmata algarum]MDY3554330.1 HDOD domain-containing protein [Gemmata algarum]
MSSSKLTSWITRSATSRAVPHTTTNHDQALEAILSPAQLPQAPAVAVRVVEAATHDDCLPREIGAMIANEPGFAASLLRTVNTAREAASRPVNSVDRAVLLVGLNKVRAMALGLSLPALRPQARYDRGAMDHSLASISGAIIARELAARRGDADPEEDLNAALLRDIGVLLIQQTYPTAWAEHIARDGDPLLAEACQREREAFGIDHAEVSAEVLKRWGLPDEIYEPIRHHHHPERLAGTRYAQRAELLWFAGLLTRLEAVVEHPDALDLILSVAGRRFGFSVGSLAEFLDTVRPQIRDFADVLNREIGRCPDYASLLTHAAAELSRGSPGRAAPVTQ